MRNMSKIWYNQMARKKYPNDSGTLYYTILKICCSSYQGVALAEQDMHKSPATLRIFINGLVLSFRVYYVITLEIT